MGIHATSRIVRHRHDRAIDLSNTLSARFAVPANTTAARVRIAKETSGDWATTLTVSTPEGALPTAVSIDDPGTNTLLTQAVLDEAQLAGLAGAGMLVVGPAGAGSGRVWIEVEFTVTDA